MCPQKMAPPEQIFEEIFPPLFFVIFCYMHLHFIYTQYNFSTDTNRNIKRSVYCQYGQYGLTFRALALRSKVKSSVRKIYIFKPNRTSCEKCNSKASVWELNPRPWISRPTLYRLSYGSRCSLEAVWVQVLYIYIKDNIWHLHSLSTDICVYLLTTSVNAKYYHFY